MNAIVIIYISFSMKLKSICKLRAIHKDPRVLLNGTEKWHSPSRGRGLQRISAADTAKRRLSTPLLPLLLLLLASVELSDDSGTHEPQCCCRRSLPTPLAKRPDRCSLFGGKAFWFKRGMSTA